MSDRKEGYADVWSILNMGVRVDPVRVLVDEVTTTIEVEDFIETLHESALDATTQMGGMVELVLDYMIVNDYGEDYERFRNILDLAFEEHAYDDLS